VGIIAGCLSNILAKNAMIKSRENDEGIVSETDKKEMYKFLQRPNVKELIIERFLKIANQQAHLFKLDPVQEKMQSYHKQNALREVKKLYPAAIKKAMMVAMKGAALWIFSAIFAIPVAIVSLASKK